jgi:hypothetical protein
VIDVDHVAGSQQVLVPSSLADGAPGWQPFRPTLSHLTLGYMRGEAQEVAA